MSTSTSSATPFPVRDATADDRAEVREVALESGLFDVDEVGLVLDAFDSDRGGPSASLWLVAGGDRVEGAAYCAPEPGGDRVWNLLFLAVRPAAQRRGIASALMSEVMRRLEETAAARLLLVETSSTAGQEGARLLYARRGFTEAAVIPDFYGDGDDKVVFTRRLS